MSRIEPGNRVDRFLSGVGYFDGQHPSAVFAAATTRARRHHARLGRRDAEASGGRSTAATCP
jgi:hypothetical protein